jgi:nucleoside-diphosphate-sugar epimerase
MTILITGVAGFIGMNLAKKILEENGIEVSVISLSYFPKNERISKKIINVLNKFIQHSTQNLLPIIYKIIQNKITDINKIFLDKLKFIQKK